MTEEIVCWTIFATMVIALVFPYTLLLIDSLFDTSYSCKIMGWHNGKGNPGVRTFDGCSIHAECSKCGTHVMLDGQGNWF